MWATLAILIVLAAIFAAHSTSSVVEVQNPPNTPEQQAKHYMVLVSLDGFRYDYATKYGARNLLAMARGATAPDGMIPSFPSVTSPNHYSIVTNIYPDHHGIIGNTFYDPARNETYSFGNPKATSDGSWYGGTPLWVLAEQQGMCAACFSGPAQMPFFTPVVTELILGHFGSSTLPKQIPDLNRQRLTAREREIVQLLAEGKSTKQVASSLGISTSTAVTHRTNIMRKLGIHNMSDLVHYALRNQIVQE
jgi:DNA-binding CsgD family transcriptional regulator